MLLEELFDYKNEVMKILCSNKQIVSLVTGEDDCACPNPSLAYTQIFPYEYMPETVEEAKTFICFDVDVSKVINKTYLMPVLYIWIFSHKSKLSLKEGGVRIDKLATEINKVFNGSRDFGLGELNLANVSRFVPAEDYLGRALVYRAVDFNRPKTIKSVSV